MEIANNRRARLKLWFEDRPIPEKEKSYFSQLMSGKASFGERAARRIERDYLMGDRYLDQPAGDAKRHSTTGIVNEPGTLKRRGTEQNWPFSVSFEVFNKLPAPEKAKINDFVEYTVDRWHASQQNKSRKSS